MPITNNQAIKYLIKQVVSNDGLGNVTLQPIWPETIGSQLKPETAYRQLGQSSFVLGGTYDVPGGTLSGITTTVQVQSGDDAPDENVTLLLPNVSGTLATIDDVNAVVVSVGDGIFDLDNTNGVITVAPYSSGVADNTWVGTAGNAGKFYLGTENPVGTTRLNYNGSLYTKALYVDGSAVITSATYVDPTLENVLTQGNKTTLGFSVVDDIDTTNTTYFEVTSAGAITAADLASLDGGINVNDDFTVDVDGNVVGVTATFSGLSSLDGGIDVNNSNFTVSTAGAIDTASTLTVDGLSSLDGGIDVNNSNFTVSTAGAVYAASTLEVDGTTQLDGTLDVNSTSDFSGNVTLSAAADLIIKDASGTPVTVFSVDGATGNVVAAGDLAVNGGDITTTATSATLFDSNATTVNAFGAATTVNLGYDGTGSSTTNINTGITANGETTTVNIGTGGDTGSTTVINLGATGAGANGSTVKVYGNLDVQGTINYIDTETLNISDNKIVLNSDLNDSPGAGWTAGIEVKTGASTSQTLFWDHGESRWEIDGNPIAVQNLGLNQFASTTSAQLAGVLSDETGFSTGAKAVFSNNPSLAGLTSSADVNLTSAADLIIKDASGTPVTVFSVDGATGNTDIAGTLTTDGLSSLDGGIDVNGSNFTVSTAGAVYAASTLEVDGTTQLDGTVDINNSLTVDGSIISLDSTGNSNFTVTGNSANLLSLSLDAINNGSGNANLNLSADNYVVLDSADGIVMNTLAFDMNGLLDWDGGWVNLTANSGSIASKFEVVNAENGGDPELIISAANTFAGGDGTATVTIAASTNAASSGIGVVNIDADEINIIGATDITGALTATTFNGLTIDTTTGTLDVANSKTLTVDDSTTLGTNSITLASTESLTLQHASLVVGDATGTGTITIKSNSSSDRSLTLEDDTVIKSLTNGHVLYASAAGTIDSEAQLAVSRGGTGIGSYTTGDILYASGTTTLSKLAGNTTTTKKFLRQTGNGSASAAPAWDTLVNSDLPDSGVSDYFGDAGVDLDSEETTGTFTAVTVNSKGVVVAAYQTVQIGYYETSPGESTNLPSANLIAGGLFFEALEPTPV